MKRRERSNCLLKCKSELNEIVEDRLFQAAFRRSKLEYNTCGSTLEHFQLSFIEDVPIIRPTEKQFSDPIALWTSLNHYGSQYGAVKIIPPSEWSPNFSLDMSKLQFKVREQKLHRLKSYGAFKFPKKTWTADEFKQFSDKFKEKYQWRTLENSLESNDAYTVNDYEKEYWYLIESQNTPVKVLYAADVEVNKTGSGFPNQQTKNSKDLYYATHPWNLLNLPYSNGSLLKYLKRLIPGITNPWLYLGMVFSTFCWHTEDDYFASVNYQHLGDKKIWYVIPPDKALEMQSLLKEYFLGLRKTSDVLHSLTVQISPNLLKANNIPVYRITQNKNEFVLLWPCAYHCGFNTGFNCNEACNIAPPVWLNWGHRAGLSYRFLRPSCIPFEQIIYLASAQCFAIQSVDEAVGVLSALSRVISEDFRLRQKAPTHYLQLPLFLSKSSVQFKKSSSFNKKSELTEHDILNENHANSNCFLLHEDLERSCMTAAETHVNFESDSNEKFCNQADRVARFPFRDCCVCYASCYQTVCCCLHATTPLCIRCLSQRKLCTESVCKTGIILYRFPFQVQFHLYKLLKEKVIEFLNDKEIKNDLPELTECICFEKERAVYQNLLKKNYQFFNIHDDSENNHTKMTQNDLTIQNLYFYLSTREISLALMEECKEDDVDDDTSTGSSSNCDSMEWNLLKEQDKQFFPKKKKKKI